MRHWWSERLPRSRVEAAHMLGELVAVVLGTAIVFFGRRLIFHWFGF